MYKDPIAKAYQEILEEGFLDDAKSLIGKHASNIHDKIKDAKTKISGHILSHTLSQPTTKKNLHDKLSSLDHDDVSAKHISHVLLHGDNADLRSKAAAHKHASGLVLDVALKDHDLNVRKSALKNKNATAQQLHNSLSSHSNDPVSSGIHANLVASHQNASHESLSKLSNHGSSDVRTAVAKNANSTSEHLHNVISSDRHHALLHGADTDATKAALNHANATHEHVQRALDSGNEDMAVHAMGSHAVTHKQALHTFNNATSENVRNAARDAMSRVRKQAE